MNPLFAIESSKLTHFCERHYIKRLSLFGSQSKGTRGR